MSSPLNPMVWNYKHFCAKHRSTGYWLSRSHNESYKNYTLPSAVETHVSCQSKHTRPNFRGKSFWLKAPVLPFLYQELGIPVRCHTLNSHCCWIFRGRLCSGCRRRGCRLSCSFLQVLIIFCCSSRNTARRFPRNRQRCRTRCLRLVLGFRSRIDSEVTKNELFMKVLLANIYLSK